MAVGDRTSLLQVTAWNARRTYRHPDSWMVHVNRSAVYKVGRPQRQEPPVRHPWWAHALFWASSFPFTGEGRDLDAGRGASDQVQWTLNTERWLPTEFPTFQFFSIFQCSSNFICFFVSLFATWPLLCLFKRRNAALSFISQSSVHYVTRCCADIVMYNAEKCQNTHFWENVLWGTEHAVESEPEKKAVGLFFLPFCVNLLSH